ncbi:hypothetical protein JCM10213_006323 [Rhodosporidiobolus nylandii]
MAVTASSTPSFAIPSSHDDLRIQRAAWLPPAQSRAPGASNSPAHARSQPALPVVEPHSVSFADVLAYRASHPQEPLRPPVGSEVMDKATLKNYRAPQHPASRVLQSIPPRAPSRSSRSNILSYTLHLATSSRLSSYSSASGSRSLLYLAEAELPAHDAAVKVDDAWFDAEQKTQGLWKLGANLLQSARAGSEQDTPALPPSVELRVHLAGLVEDLLLSPAAERAVTKIDAESTQSSADVDELVALKPLTARDPTMLYHTTSASSGGVGGDASSSRPRVNSVAQSLIDLKFGGKADPAEQLSPSFPDDKPLADSPLSLDAAGVSSSSSASAPHLDYRIVLSQSMRTRARTIFAASPLPALTISYCRSHRVPACSVCAAICTAASEREGDHAARRRTNTPGSGLRLVPGSNGSGAGAKKPLVALIPAFLELSAALLRDVKDRANRPLQLGSGNDDVDELLSSVLFTESSSPAAPVQMSLKGKERATEAEDQKEQHATVEMQVTAEWYDLLTLLLMQACLEGYLVDGWTGTDGAETLFGVGCGVWEGRGWSTSSSAFVAPADRRSSVSHEGESDDEDEDEYEERRRIEEKQKKERSAAVLVEAARALFGSRDVAQADYERGMRDRTHEFLNVPPSKSLHAHLDDLSRKYPLSQFEDKMVDFIEAAVKLLGKPALAKYDPRASSSASAPASSNDANPDPYALIRYFAPSSFSSVSPPAASPRREDGEDRRRPHRAWEDEPEEKRRRVE